MAFKQITDNGKFAEYFPKKAAERKDGDFVIGVYKGTKSVKRPDGRDDIIYVLEGEKGLIGVNTSPVLATKMEQVSEGMTIKVVYEGKERSAKSGREYNNFSVWIDEEEGEEKQTKLPF